MFKPSPTPVVYFLCGVTLLVYARPGSAQSCIAANLANLSVGFSLNHFTVANAECGPGVRVTKAENNILLHYGDAGAAGRVDRLLATMKNDGASAMREHLWYRHAEDTAFQLRLGDPIGLLVAADGKLPERAVSNFAAIVSDAKKLGYRRFVVLFGVQGSANTKCRKDVSCKNQIAVLIANQSSSLR